MVIEACEESGSRDLPFYINHLKDKIKTPSLIICLDSGCGNYDQVLYYHQGGIKLISLILHDPLAFFLLNSCIAALPLPVVDYLFAERCGDGIPESGYSH